mgnify:CR=1 FL=1
MTKTIRIATRKSPLAMWQAEHIRNALLSVHSNIEVVLIGLTTKGDKFIDSPLAKLGGKGLFVKELENKILDKTADIAVHSMKDVPVFLPEGLQIGAILDRDDPRDAFVSNKYDSLTDLPENSIIGTSSLRRQCQLLEKRPDLQIKSLRGNVNTRLSRLDEKKYDAIILAAAGLKRLNLKDRISSYLDKSEFLPAIGQGIIGIECRNDDSYIKDLLEPLHNKKTEICLTAERSMNKGLDGGCQVPIGGHANLKQEDICLKGLVGSIDGKKIIRAEKTGPKNKMAEIGNLLAKELLENGADEILKNLYKQD